MARKDESENPMTTEERLVYAIELLARRQSENPNDSRSLELMERLTTALDRVAANQLEGSKMIVRAQRPSNEVVPMRSVFNPRGETIDEKVYRKPQLKCRMLIPWEAENESLTREEVELLNLLQPGQYIVKRIDDSKIRMTVQAEYDVTGKKMSKLLLNHETGFNNDNFKLMPSFPTYLRQMLKQHDDPAIGAAARVVLTMEEEQDLIESGELAVSV